MAEGEDVCRDFERGDCNRGDKCKYVHPEGAAPAKEEGKLNVCKDFQNKGCSRMRCKFLHLTHEEVVIHNSTGVLPEHGGRPEISFAGNKPSVAGNDVCKDFLNGRCDRGSRCKFVHVSEKELQSNGASMGGGMYGKRPRGDDFYGGARTNDAALLEENEILRRKITDLQKQILNLRQMNDTLYDENTRYRSQLKNSSTGVVSQVNAYAQSVQYSPAAYPQMSGTMPAAAAAAITSGVNTYSY